jgi:hypothetical protein
LTQTQESYINTEYKRILTRNSGGNLDPDPEELHQYGIQEDPNPKFWGELGPRPRRVTSIPNTRGS